MKTYASFNVNPSPVPYLTPGKKYEAGYVTDSCFTIVADNGKRLLCLWERCGYLDGGNWTRHDETDALRDAAPEMYEALKEAISLMEALGVKGGRYVRALAAIAKAEGKV